MQYKPSNSVNLFIGVEVSDIQLNTMQENQLGNDAVYENLQTVRKTSPLDDFIDGRIKNPIPKPPRSGESGQSTPVNEYMNLTECRNGANVTCAPEMASQPAPDFDIDLMDRLDTFASAMDDADGDVNDDVCDDVDDNVDEEFRPLPPIPDEDEADNVEENVLSASELDELYATVDKPKRSQSENENEDGIQRNDQSDQVDCAVSKRNPDFERKISKDVSKLEEGKFKIQVMREFLIC